MRSKLQGLAISGMEHLYDRVARTPAVRRLTYPIRNRRLFTDLYQHDSMLADRVRVNTYAEALVKHVRESDVVVDVGTGSGILAFLAAKQRPKTVYAIDHSPLIQSAEEVARDNGIQGVSFYRSHSSQFHPPLAADLIIHEQMGDALLDERMIETIVDLRDRVLNPGGRIIPSRFELFLTPVQLRDEYAVPFAWEQRLHGIDFRALRRGPGTKSRRYYRRTLQPCQFSHPLSNPVSVFNLDLATIASEAASTTAVARARVTSDGRLDGLCVSFVAHLDEELQIDTSPFTAGVRPTNWGNPLLRLEGMRRLSKGDEIRIKLEMRDPATPATWRWSCRMMG